MTVGTTNSAPPRTPVADSTSASLAAARSRFARASALGGAVAVVLFTWMVTRGTWNLFEWQRVGEFYDQQAHSLLNGHLSIDASYLGIEAFTVDGSSHIYQGPIPAILRLPIVAVAGGALDGRLTQLSMLAAFVTAVTFATRLHWKVRVALRDDAPVTRGEAMLVGLFTFVVGGGSSLLYEASRAWVYHEALLWGAAFALASIDSMVAYTKRPSFPLLAGVVIFAACTLLTRASTGIGPVTGLGLFFIGSVAARASAHWPRRARRLATSLAPGFATQGGVGSGGISARQRAVAPWVLAIATALPVVAYSVVNYAKFDRLFSIPFSAQRFSEIDPGRQEFLRVNHNTMFGPQFAPTTALQYLRPDAIRFTKEFPFLDFADFPGPVIGDVTFDLIDRSSSVPTAMPLLTVLTGIGLVTLFRRRARRPDDQRPAMRVPALAAGASALAVVPFGYIANRYLTDFVPLLAFVGAVGFQAIVGTLTDTATRAWPRVALVGAVVLATFGTWVNIGLALNYQRLWSYNLDPPVIAGYLGFQHDLGGIGDVVRVPAGSRLPDGVGRPGLLAVVGDCEGLYLSDGLPVNVVKTTPWNAVEQTRVAGHFDLRVTFPRRPAGTRVPILSFEDSPAVLFAEYTNDRRVFLEYREPDRDLVVRGVPRGTDPRRVYTLDVRADPNIELLVVKRDDIVMLDAAYHYRGNAFRVGKNATALDVAAEFPGRLISRPVGAPLCRELLAEARHR